MNTSLLAAAIGPSLILILYIYFRDKYHKEPLRLIIFSFLLGIVSVVIPLFLGPKLTAITGYTLAGNSYEVAFFAFINVALIEEFAKWAMCMLFMYRNRHFDEPIDGIVYALTVSMGFAAFENILYVMQGGWEVAQARAFTAIPAHGTFGVLMGYFLGKAKFSVSGSTGLLLFLSLLIPTFFHGAYDYFLMDKNIPGITGGALVSLFIGIRISLGVIRKLNERKRRV